MSRKNDEDNTEGQAMEKRWLFGLVCLFFLLGVVYSVAVPLFEAPDELWHFSFIRFLADERRLPVQPTVGKDMWLREAGQPPLYYLTLAPLVAGVAHADFPDFVRFNVAHPAITAGASGRAPNVFIHTHYEQFPYRGAVLAVHLARLATLAWGAATVVGAYLLAREVCPRRPAIVWMTAGVTAFNPAFVYISSAVNNDACAACCCTYALWLAVRMTVRDRSRPVDGLMLGVVTGLALLSKMSALALPALAGLALLLYWQQKRRFRTLLTLGGWTFIPMALLGGWWYLRNRQLYGDPLAWGVWLADIGVHTIGPLELVRQFGHVATSFWSPYDDLFPPGVWGALGALAVLAVIGWLRLIRHREMRQDIHAAGLLLTELWFLVLYAGLVRYMLMTPSDEGRLLFPALPAFALLWALGLESGLRSVCLRWRNEALGLVGAGLLVLGAWTPAAIAARYAWPVVDATSPDALEADVRFRDAALPAPDSPVILWGADVTPDVTPARGEVQVTLFWRVQQPPPVDLRAVVQLWTLGGRLVGQRDTIPAGERYPPDLWRPGDVVRDTYFISIDEGKKGPAVCQVTVDLRSGEEPIGSVTTPPLLWLTSPPLTVPTDSLPTTYVLGERIELLGYTLTPATSSEGEVKGWRLTLYWRMRVEMDGGTERNKLYGDETVFVHLVGGDGTLLAQGDGPPLEGDYPPLYWLPGDVLADAHQMAWPGDLPVGAHFLVGMYRLTNGGRLPVYTARGIHVPDEAIVIPADE
ncbi:MAG TPA: hypothetical protein ENF52_05950 [Chloroflexi bacterium]|nr:hypothetical protein [Chloroflexota bacterium]